MARILSFIKRDETAVTSSFAPLSLHRLLFPLPPLQGFFFLLLLLLLLPRLLPLLLLLLLLLILLVLILLLLFLLRGLLFLGFELTRSAQLDLAGRLLPCRVKNGPAVDTSPQILQHGIHRWFEGKKGAWEARSQRALVFACAADDRQIFHLGFDPGRSCQCENPHKSESAATTCEAPPLGLGVGGNEDGLRFKSAMFYWLVTRALMPWSH